ncbi:MAG TPA: hypothetical protein PKH10_00165 [bacterium]|nr:hypothetical protein [bacterium]
MIINREENSKVPDIGFFEFLMKPLPDRVRVPYQNLKSSFRPLEVRNFLPFPMVGNSSKDEPRNKNIEIWPNEWHSCYIHPQQHHIFSFFINGFFIFRTSYFEDLKKDPRDWGEPVLAFENIIIEITRSLMLAKQMYKDTVGVNEKIAFKWTLTKTKKRTLIPPNHSGWSLGGIYTCFAENVFIVRTYKYGELSEYISLSKDVIDKIFVAFNWPTGKSLIDDFQKDFLGHFKD